MQDKRIQNKRILQYQELRFVGLIYIYFIFPFNRTIDNGRAAKYGMRGLR